MRKQELRLCTSFRFRKSIINLHLFAQSRVGDGFNLMDVQV